MSSKFQNVMLIGIAVVVIALFLRRPEKQIPIVQDIQVTQPKERSITVTGTGDVTVKLDTAEFVIYYETNEKELVDAKIANEKIYKETVVLLKRYGIEDKDISDYLQAEVKTKITTENVKQITGYVVHRSMKVTVHHLEELDPLFVSLQEAGKYDITDIVLRLSDTSAYEEQATQEAMEDANKKAKAIGRTLNREIGQEISINSYSGSRESSSSFVYSFDTIASYFSKVRMYPDFSVPEIIISAWVNVVYELK